MKLMPATSSTMRPLLALSLCLPLCLFATACTQYSRGPHTEYPYEHIPAERPADRASRQGPGAEQGGTADQGQTRGLPPRPTVPDSRNTPPPRIDTPPPANAHRRPGHPPPTVPRTQSASPAVVALSKTADQQYADGQLDAAASSLERALRIDPRNALLWHKLAAVRLANNELQQAESLGQKSISLAGDDRQLMTANWRLIAEARRRNGDTDGALEADRTAVTYDDSI